MVIEKMARPFYIKLGKRLAHARRDADMDQSEVAAEISRLLGRVIPYQTYGAWERGENAIPADALAVLPEALHRTANYFLGLPEEGGLSAEEMALVADFRRIQNEDLRKLAADAVRVQARADGALRRTTAGSESPQPESEKRAPVA